MARFRRQTRRNDSKIAGMYDLEERLGAGHFAEVKLARHVFTGERVAVKVIDKLKLDDTARHHLYQEVRCMKLVQHPNIVRLYEVIDTNTKLYLVQELGDGGDMYDYIMRQERGLSEEKARRYFRQILQAIDYCHKLFVVHRDLKPENVIFFKKFDVAKLTDFGFSNHFMPGKKLETACGSLAYSAPEILLGDSYDAPAVDVWSLGVILYMMVVGKAPFYEANESETLTMILDCKFHVPDHVSPACKSLILRMIVRDALKRASLEDIMNDPWILQDVGPLLLTTVPLANRVKLGDDQHNEVVQKMQLGDIADKETIKKCLDAGSYNHVSATYYLLAEQVLRRLHWPKKNVSSTSCATQSNENKSHVSNSARELPKDTTTGETHPNNSSQQCPIFGDSVEDLPSREPDDLDETELSDIETNLVTSRLTYHSTESIYDQLRNNTDEQHDVEEMVGAVSVSMTKKQRKVFKKRRVTKVKSTPAFLNQISEERESDLDDSPRASPRMRRPSRRALDMLKAQQKDRRPSPASASGGRRSSSVSSSSEDDGDLDKKMRRLSTERCRRSPKRRSDDEGDGDDGEGGSRSPSGVARKKMMSDTSSRSRDAQEVSAESGKKSDVEGKCANAGLFCAVLQDKLVEVNLKLGEALNAKVVGTRLKVDAPCDSGRAGGTQDFTGNENGFMESSHTRLENDEETRRDDYSNENESLNRTNVDDDRVDEVLEDGIMKNRIMKDGIEKVGIMEVGIMEVELTKDRIKKDEVTEDAFMEGGIMNDGIMKDGIMGDGIVKDGVMNDGVMKDGIMNDGIMKDGIMNDGIMKDGIMNDGVMKDGILEDGIMEIFEGRKCVDIDDSEGNENISDKENLNVSTNGETLVVCSKHDGSRHHVFRGSDIDEIEMYMKAKDTGLELDSVAVRTIFNNRKVSRITSNCCQII